MPECFSYDAETGTLTLYSSITTTESLGGLKPVKVCFAGDGWSEKDEIINNILQIVCKWNEDLKSCELPDGLTKINDNAFWYCTGLTNITIPKGVTEIGYGAFSGCKSLTSVTIPKGVTEIGVSAFFECDALTGVIIPKGVTKIGECAFCGCGLTNITIPKGVTEIGDGAFCGCEELTKVKFCGNVENIGRDIFKKCPKLQTIEVCSENMQKKISEYIAKAGLNVSVVVSQNTQTNPKGSVSCRKKIPPVIPYNNRGR